MNIYSYDNKDNHKRITLRIEPLHTIYGMLFNTSIKDIGKSIKLKISDGKYFVKLVTFNNDDYNIQDMDFCTETIHEISGFEYREIEEFLKNYPIEPPIVNPEPIIRRSIINPIMELQI
jgi:hypothetical protein